MASNRRIDTGSMQFRWFGPIAAFEEAAEAVRRIALHGLADVFRQVVPAKPGGQPVRDIGRAFGGEGVGRLFSAGGAFWLAGHGRERG